jgi:hypothetical protein
MTLKLAAIALATALMGASPVADQLAVDRRWNYGTQRKRSRTGSMLGCHKARKARNRTRNRIAAKSRAANR